MTTASELEKRLRDTPDLYVLKSNESGKSENHTDTRLNIIYM